MPTVTFPPSHSLNPVRTIHLSAPLASLPQVALVYANRYEEDILLREELDAYAAAHPGRFSVWYTLDQPPADWAFSTGHINEEMLQQHLLPAGPDSIACLCGPPGMIKFACLPNLAKMGYSEESMIQF